MRSTHAHMTSILFNTKSQRRETKAKNTMKKNKRKTNKKADLCAHGQRDQRAAINVHTNDATNDNENIAFYVYIFGDFVVHSFS